MGAECVLDSDDTINTFSLAAYWLLPMIGKSSVGPWWNLSWISQSDKAALSNSSHPSVFTHQEQSSKNLIPQKKKKHTTSPSGILNVLLLLCCPIITKYTVNTVKGARCHMFCCWSQQKGLQRLWIYTRRWSLCRIRLHIHHFYIGVANVPVDLSSSLAFECAYNQTDFIKNTSAGIHGL